MVTDLRITSPEGTPITSDSLKRINATVLARAARRYATAEAAKTGRALHDALAAATAEAAKDGAAMVATAIEWLEATGTPVAQEFAETLAALDTDQAQQWVAARGIGAATARLTDADIARWPPPPGARRRRRGRPPEITAEFLSQIAEWAKYARDNNIRPVYGYVADQVVANGLRPTRPADDTVTAWIRKCGPNGLNLLERGELRQPRTPKKPQKPDTT